MWFDNKGRIAVKHSVLHRKRKARSQKCPLVTGEVAFLEFVSVSAVCHPVTMHKVENNNNYFTVYKKTH